MIEELKKEWKKALIALIVMLAIGFGKDLWDLTKSGADLEFNTKVQEQVRESLKDPKVAKEIMNNPEIMRVILASEAVKEYIDEAGKEIRNKIVQDVSKSDTNKISMRSFIGEAIDERDENVLPLLADLLKAYKAGDLMTEDQVEEIIKKRRRTAQF